jgi:uncharacterized repeat protein (TIGR02543 family)
MQKHVLPLCFGLLAAFALAFIFTACETPTSTITKADLTGTVAIQKDGAAVNEAVLGDELTAIVSGSNATTFVYQWQKKTGTGDFTNIPDANSLIYRVAEPVAVGDVIKVLVSATDFNKSIESNGVPVVNPDDPALTGDVTIARDPAGTPVRIGDTVKATPAGLNEGAIPLYQWQKKTGTGDFTDILSANSETYLISEIEVSAKDYIRVYVRADNHTGRLESNEIQVFAIIENIEITHERIEIIPFDPENLTKVGKGRTLQFFAEVSGQHLTAEDEEVTWSVAGTSATASGTGISADGLLTAALTESNTTLTVTARSKTDTNVTKAIDVQVVAVHFVTFDTDGGTPVESRVVDIIVDNVGVVEAGKTMGLYVGSIGWSYVSTKEGALFNGWLNSSGSPVYSVAVNSDVTLKARWIIPYWVTLDLNGGTLLDEEGNDLPLIYSILPGGTFAPHSYVPTKAGDVVFYGWFISTDSEEKVLTGPNGYTGSDGNGNTTMAITSDITFKAKWGPGAIFTFELNGGEYPPGVQTVYRFAPRDKVFLEQYLIPTHPEGLSFRGWASITDYVYGRFEIITIVDESPITLTASWVEGTVVTLNLNGGEFPLPWTGIPVPTTYERAPGTIFNVPFTNPVREGYLFTGWYLDAALQNRLPQSGITVGTEPVTIYAGWLDLGFLGVYVRADGGAAVIIENTNAGIFCGTFTESACSVFSFDDAGAFLQIIDEDTITVLGDEFTRVTGKKTPAYHNNTALRGTWKQSAMEGGTVMINLMDWDENGSTTFTYETPDWDYLTIPLSYVVEGNTLYLLRKVTGQGPGEVIWGIPIVNNALQGWTK